jgi:hypothetical protein
MLKIEEPQGGKSTREELPTRHKNLLGFRHYKKENSFYFV